MASYSADAIIDECQAFIDMGEQNYLYSSFEERLAAADLPDETKKAYIEANSEHIKNYIFPAYAELKEGLTALRPKPERTTTDSVTCPTAGNTTSLPWPPRPALPELSQNCSSQPRDRCSQT